jgi:NADPH:quinone reductase-like Zn-dependent oxidoreductase
MRWYVLEAGQSGIEGLKQVEHPSPRPGYGQALVRVRAASLNHRDLYVVANPVAPARAPLVPLSDGAGEVVAVGEGVTRVKPGDRVAGIFFQDWIAGKIRREVHARALGGSIDGMLSEEVALSADGLVKVPEHLSFEEASTLPCAGVTAWHALNGHEPLLPGQTVLALGTGGVSIFALQFAKAQGARVIVTSSSDEKLARARELGADDTINYVTTPEWDRAALELTGGLGVDRVIEVGGAGTLPRSLRSARDGGRVSVIGGLAGRGGTEISPVDIFARSLAVQGIYVGSREHFETMNRAIEQVRLRPVIDRVFPFDEAQEAYRYLESGPFGKVVITMPAQ